MVARHLMFETQYPELALAVDPIAERIRASGEPAPFAPPAPSSRQPTQRTTSRPPPC